MNKHTPLIFTSGSCFKIQSSRELSAHGWGKKYSKPFSTCPQKVHRQVLWKERTKFCRFYKRYLCTARSEASGRASALSVTVPSPSGQMPTRLRHINTISCRFLLFQSLLLHGPASSAATHIFGTPSRSKVTAQLDPSSDAWIREVLVSNPDRKHSRFLSRSFPQTFRANVWILHPVWPRSLPSICSYWRLR